MKSFGSYIREEREKRGIRLEEISSITKIQLHHLNDLEKSVWENLPPEPFIRGFILAYAKYVGLNVQEVIERYQDEVHPSPTKINSETVQEPFENRQPSSFEFKKEKGVHQNIVTSDRKNPIRLTLQMGISVLGLGIVVFLISLGRQAENSSREITASETSTGTPQTEPAKMEQVATVPDKPIITIEGKQTAEVTKVEPMVTEKKTIEGKKEEPIEIAIDQTSQASVPLPPQTNSAPHEITVKAREKSWMKVVIDEAPPKQSILNPGDKTTFSAKEKIKLVLGNTPDVDVTYNGNPAIGKKFSGTIYYFIYPRNSRFPQDAPKKTPEDDEATPSRDQASEPSENTEKSSQD